jgi:hypothetical protein
MTEQPVPRDPRVEPRVGDVVRNDTITLEVSSRQPEEFVSFWRHNSANGDFGQSCYRLSSWRDIAKHCTIINVAEG